MKNRLLTTLAFSFLAAPVLAGGPIAVEPEPAAMAAAPMAAAHDWSGGYVGLSYGKTSADINIASAVLYDFSDGQVAGIHGGYLAQRGSFVYGGELAYGKVSDSFIPGFGDDDEVEYVLDVKARAGLAADRAMFYGVLGYSKSNYSETGIASYEVDVDGVAYGLGAEFAVSQRFVIGLEYVTRDLSGAFEGLTVDTSLDTLSLRAGISF